MSHIDPSLEPTQPIDLPEQAPYAPPVSFTQHIADRSTIPTSRKQVKAAERQPRGVIYTREQKGHSLTLHLLLGMPVLWLNVVVLSLSPRHYWHA